MHRAALLALLLASQTAAADTRYITVGADALGTVTATAAHTNIHAADGEVAVLEVDELDLEAIAREMHERHGRCGGFIAHDSLEDAMQKDKKPKPPIEYTLDRPVIVRDVLGTIDRANILGTIRELSAMPSRLYKSASGAAASTWLRDRWRSFSGRTDITIELVDHGYPQKSVMLTIPGTSLASEVVVIGGHLDSITFGGGGTGAPGADDDASGIATMTEVLRALLAADYRPARTLVFVAYAAEEIGLRGSQGVVKLFEKRGINAVGALQLDMTNYQGSDKDIWLIKDFTSAPQNEFLIKLIDTYVGATWGLDACGYACSDHASWYRAGVPASMPFESRMRERNMSIHSARDTLEASGNNADHAVKFARLAAAYAVEMGKGTVKPHDLLAPGIGRVGVRPGSPCHGLERSEGPGAAPAPTDSCNWTWALLAALAAAGILLERRVTR